MPESMQPIVLVGGRSRRFGRDKLREPVGEGWLVDRPIGALRGVFGARVAVVGECDPGVARRGDLVIEDRYPGAGPAGGILSALETTEGDVFVLAGDLARVSAGSVRAVVRGAAAHPAAWVVLAQSHRVEPCIGVYRRAVAGVLRERLRAGRGSLFDLVGAGQLRLVGIDPVEAVNINTPEGLEGLRG